MVIDESSGRSRSRSWCFLCAAGRAHLSAVGSPTAAIRDPADLLDVHMDQLAGPLAFVAQRSGLRGPDPLSGQWVALAQTSHAITAQDPGHRPWGQTELGAEPVLSATLRRSCIEHALLDLPRSCRHPERSRRTVVQTRVALGSEASDPTMRTLPRHAHRLGNVSDWHPFTDPLHQQSTTMKRQTGVTVRHEDLRAVKT